MVYDEKRIGDAMVSNFSSVSSLDNFTEEFVYNMVQSELQGIDFFSPNEEDYNCSITSEELEAALKSTGDTSPGPDQIPYVLLRKTNVEQRKVLLDFYNQVWSSHYVPKQWKQAILIPLIKPEKPANKVTSYRPIALTNCLCKIYEKIITQRLTYHLDIKNILTLYQSGFRKKYSTYDGTVRLESDIRDAFVRDEYVIAIFLDIEKAFDSVRHHGLLRKIHNHGLRGHDYESCPH